MEVIYGLLPFIIVIGFVMVGVLFWAIKSGQFEDLEGPASRILTDDDDPMLPKYPKSPPVPETGRENAKKSGV